MSTHTEWPPDNQATRREAETLIKKLRQCPLAKFTIDDLETFESIRSRLKNGGAFAVSEGQVEFSATCPDRKFLKELLVKVSAE